LAALSVSVASPARPTSRGFVVGRRRCHGRRRRDRGGLGRRGRRRDRLRRVVDDDVPPRRAERSDRQEHRHRHDEQALGDDAVARRAAILGPGAPHRTGSEGSGDEPRHDAPDPASLESLEILRHGDAVLIGREPGRDLRVDDRPAEDVDEIEEGEKKPGSIAAA